MALFSDPFADPSYDPTQDPNSPYYQSIRRGGLTSPNVTAPTVATSPVQTDPTSSADLSSALYQLNKASSKPSGGNVKDPAYAAQLVAWYANQPGANPSLKNDPNYWIGKLTSGELGTDENYIIGKFMTPEGAPSGGGTSTGGAAGSTPTAFTFPTFTPPSFTAPTPFAAPSPYTPGTFSYQDFKAPTLEEAQNQPGYAFGLQQGEAALQNSAAARGTLRSGGTLKDLFNYANNAATQNYGNVFNQDLGVYQTNRGNAFENFATNEANRAAAYGTNFGVAKDVYGINANQNQQTYENQFQNASAAFNPQFEASKLSFADMYNRWLASLNATTQIATAGAS